MTRNTFIIFLLLIASSCKTQKAVVQAPPPPPAAEVTQDKRPGWVFKQPLDESYYVGIAGVQKKPGDRNYKDAARKDALHMLCSQIEVNINSKSYLVTINRDYKFKQDYLTASKASVNTNVEGYNISDEYEDEKEYWVYLSLSKAEYRRRKQEKLNQASNTSLQFLEQADKFSQEKKYSPAVLFYGKALAAMKNYLNEAVEAEYKGKQVYLVNECFGRLQTMLNDIRLQFAESSATVKFGIPLNRKIDLTASSSVTRSNLPNLPLQFRFTSGKGQMIGSGSTNEKGRSQISIQKITSNQGFQQIEVIVDIEKICASDTGWKDIKPFIDRLNKPTASIFLTVVAPKFYSTSVEKNLGKPLPEPMLMKLIDKRLFETGFQLTVNKNEADYILYLESSTGKINVVYEMVNTQLKLDLNVKLKGEVVYTHTKSDVKGIRLDEESSGMNAYKNASEYIDQKIIPELIKLIYN